MNIEDIKVGHTYTAGPKSRPRMVLRFGFWWSSRRHGLVYYIGRDGREIEVSDIAFAQWAQRDVTPHPCCPGDFCDGCGACLKCGGCKCGKGETA